jgi:hypothetical protein
MVPSLSTFDASKGEFWNFFEIEKNGNFPKGTLRDTISIF